MNHGRKRKEEERKRINKSDLMKIKCSAKEKPSLRWGHAAERRNICKSHLHEGLPSASIKSSSVRQWEIKNSIKKQSKCLNQHFMNRTHRRRVSTCKSFSLTSHEGNANQRLGVDEVKIVTPPNASKDVEKGDHSLIAHGDWKWCSHSGNWCGSFLKT